MILRRVTEHVKAQNWFAVVLDFVMVVAGILIALQITNWNTGREDRRVYDQAFERVIAELNVNLEMQKGARAGIAQELPIIQRALEDLRACRADETALANVKAALVPLNSPYALVIDTAALEQFLGNDAFLQYQAPETRELLTTFLRISTLRTEYFRARSAQTIQTTASMPDALALGPLTVKGPDEILNVLLSDSPLSPPLYREPILALPLDVACKDKAFVGDFYDWEAGAFTISIEAGRTAQGIRGALQALGRPVANEDGETP
jgi:hypothetical protein